MDFFCLKFSFSPSTMIYYFSFILERGRINLKKSSFLVNLDNLLHKVIVGDGER